MSDQDFFFDEDEKPAKSQSKSAPAKKPATPAAKSGSSSRNVVAAPAQSVTYTVAALIGVAALLLGIIVGILLPINTGASTATPDAGLSGGGVQQTAPQLTPEQMQSGQLPAGHPNIGGAAGATGSAPATGTK